MDQAQDVYDNAPAPAAAQDTYDPAPAPAVPAAVSPAPAAAPAVPQYGGRDGVLPMDAHAAVLGVFPNARVTSWERDPNSALGKANPNSWHNNTPNAVDIAPIPGMTFQQARNMLAQKYNIIQGFDEATHPVFDTTGPNWHFTLAAKDGYDAAPSAPAAGAPADVYDAPVSHDPVTGAPQPYTNSSGKADPTATFGDNGTHDNTMTPEDLAMNGFKAQAGQAVTKVDTGAITNFLSQAGHDGMSPQAAVAAYRKQFPGLATSDTEIKNAVKYYALGGNRNPGFYVPPSANQPTSIAPTTLDVQGVTTNRSLATRTGDAFASGAMSGFGGDVAQAAQRFFGINRPAGLTDQQWNDKVTAARQSYLNQAAALEKHDPNSNISNPIDRTVANVDQFVGGSAGSAGPSWLVPGDPEAGVLANMGKQAASFAGGNIAHQAYNSHYTGDAYDPMETLEAAAIPAALHGAFSGVRYLRDGRTTLPVATESQGAPTAPNGDLHIDPIMDRDYMGDKHVVTLRDPDTGNVKALGNVHVGPSGELGPVTMFDHKTGDVYPTTPEENDYIRNRTRDIRDNQGVTAPVPTDSPHTAAIKDAVNEAKSNWTNSPDVHVVGSHEELPQHLQDELETGGNKDSAMGMYNDGKVYVLAHNLHSPAEATAVLYHEALGHAGLAGAFQDGLDNTLHDAYDRNPQLQADVDAYRARNPDAYADHPDPQARAIEEVLAKRSEGGPVQYGLADRLKTMMSQAGRAVGLNKGLSDSEVGAILDQAHSSITDGTPADTGVGKSRIVLPPERADDYDAPKMPKAANDVEAAPEPKVSKAPKVDANGVQTMYDDGKPNALKAFDPSQTPTTRHMERDPLEQYVNLNAGNLSKDDGVRQLMDSLEEHIRLNNPSMTHEEMLNEANNQIDMGLMNADKARQMSSPNAVRHLAARVLLKMALEKGAEDTAHLFEKPETHWTPADWQEFKDKTKASLQLSQRIANNARGAGQTLASYGIDLDPNTEAGSAAHDLSMFALRGMTEANLDNPETLAAYARLQRNFKDNPAALARAARDMEKPEAKGLFSSLWYNMLLSDPLTHARYYTGSAMNIGADLLNHAAAAALDTPRSMMGAADVRTWSEVAARAKGALNLVSSLGSVPGDIMRGASNPKNYLPTSVLHNMDGVFNQIISLSEYHGLGMRQALDEGRAGGWSKDEVMQRAADLSNNPSKAMLDATKRTSDRLLLHDDPSKISALFEEGMKSGRLGTAVPAVIRTVVPFLRRGDALVRTVIRWSPFGVMDRYNLAGLKEGGAERSVALSRMAIGSAIMGYVYNQAPTIDGDGPSNYQQQMDWQHSGHMPDSVKLADGRHVSIKGFGPLALGVIAAANARDAIKEGRPDESMENFSKGTLQFFTSLASNEWFEQLQPMVQALAGKTPVSGRLNQLKETAASTVASSVVPAGLRDINKSYVDPLQRNTHTDGSFSQDVLTKIQSGVPGLSQQLQPRFDMFGQPMKNVGGYLPTSPAAPNDPVTKALGVLQRPDKTLVGLAPTSVKDVLKSAQTMEDVQTKLTPAQQTAYQQKSGSVFKDWLTPVVQSDGYKNASPAVQTRMVKEVLDKARLYARVTLGLNGIPQSQGQ